MTNKEYLKAINKIEDGKEYNSFRDLCAIMEVDYNKHKNGGNKAKLIKLIESNYNIEKGKGYKRTYHKKSDEIIKQNELKLKEEDMMSSKFDTLSKVFQAGLIEYLLDKVNNGYKKLTINYSMADLMNNVNMLSVQHYYIKNQFKNSGKFNNINHNIKNEYYNQYYSNVVNRLETGLNNLQNNTGLIQYTKGYNISYEIVGEMWVIKKPYKEMQGHVDDLIIKGEKKTKYYTKEYDVKYNIIDEFTNAEEGSAMFDALDDAWGLMKKVFKLKDSNSKNKINYYNMKLFQTNAYVKKNVIPNIKGLSKKYQNVVNIFYRDAENTEDELEYNLFTVFRKFTMFKAEYYLKEQLQEGRSYFDINEDDTIIVKGYYRAYNIMFLRNRLLTQHKEIIKNILTKDDPKAVSLDYLIDKIFNSLEKTSIQSNEDLLRNVIKVCSYAVDYENENENEDIFKYYKEKYLIN